MDTENNDKKNVEDNDAITVVMDLMKRIHNEMIKGLPVWLQVRSILIATRGRNDNEIDWDRINSDLKLAPNYNHCFNIMEPVFHSIKDLQDYIVSNDSAQIMDLPYRKFTCKECKKVVTLNYRESQWYIDKGMEIPKRCKSCRDSRRSGHISSDGVLQLPISELFSKSLNEKKLKSKNKGKKK